MALPTEVLLELNTLALAHRKDSVPILCALNFIAFDFSALDLSDGSRIAEDNVELQ